MSERPRCDCEDLTKRPEWDSSMPACSCEGTCSCHRTDTQGRERVENVLERAASCRDEVLPQCLRGRQAHLAEAARRLRARQRDEGEGRLEQIADVIRHAENRAMATDGPVSKTSDVITEDELRRIYELATATPQREGERDPVAWRWRLKGSSMGWIYWPEEPTDIAEPHDWDIQPLYTEDDVTEPTGELEEAR